MEMNFTSFATIKFLTINVIAIALASVISYFVISPIASSHLILWIIVMPAIGIGTSLIQLPFIKSLVSKKGEELLGVVPAKLQKVSKMQLCRPQDPQNDMEKECYKSTLIVNFQV